MTCPWRLRGEGEVMKDFKLTKTNAINQLTELVETGVATPGFFGVCAPKIHDRLGRSYRTVMRELSARTGMPFEQTCRMEVVRSFNDLQRILRRRRNRTADDADVYAAYAAYWIAIDCRIYITPAKVRELLSQHYPELEIPRYHRNRKRVPRPRCLEDLKSLVCQG